MFMLFREQDQCLQSEYKNVRILPFENSSD